MPYKPFFFVPKRVINPQVVVEFRKKQGITQLELARFMDVSLATVKHWEQGVNRMVGAAATLLAIILDYPDLLKRY